MRQAITLYRPERVLQYVARGSELRPHGWLAPIHRLLWQLLRRLGALKDYMEETVEFRRVVIDEKAVINRIAAALDGLHYRGTTPKEVLMGPDAFAELMHEPSLPYDQSFSFDVHYNRGRNVFGLPVHVLPQMEGVLVR